LRISDWGICLKLQCRDFFDKTDFGRKVAQKERKGKEGALEMEAELAGMAFTPSCPRRLRRHRPKGL
jgi:hypothetical protein